VKSSLLEGHEGFFLLRPPLAPGGQGMCGTNSTGETLITVARARRRSTPKSCRSNTCILSCERKSSSILEAELNQSNFVMVRGVRADWGRQSVAIHNRPWFSCPFPARRADRCPPPPLPLQRSAVRSCRPSNA